MLIAKINTYPVLLLCTYRPDVTAPWVGMAHVTALHLNRLERRQSTMIVQQLSGENDLPARITEEIVAKTDGVPLFLEELTKAVLESEVLQHPDQPRSLVAQPETWTMPATLKDSLMARLDRLTGVGEVATIGAAIGRTFSYDLLAAATELTDEDLQSALKKLIDAQLLFQRGQPPDATYTFKHSLVQDTAYESLLISKRRPLHLKIASAIQSSTSGIVDKKPEILALHFARANAHAEARDYWQRAAILASQAPANSEAITHINNALIANESIEDNEERVSHEIHLRELLYVSQEATIWGSTEIVNNLERLKALKERRGDSENLLSVLHGLSGCHLIAGRVSDARSLANRLFEITNDSEKYAAAVLGNRLLGVCDLLSAEFDDAVLHFEKTIALSREIDQEKVRRYYHANNLLVSQSLMSWALVLLGEKDSAAKSISLSDQLIQAERDIYSRIYALSVLASACQSADNPKKSLKFAVLALELSQTHASPYWEAWAQILVGWGTATLGKPHEGIEKIRQGISGYQATGSLQLLPYAWTLLADAYCRTGKITKGLETIDQFEKAHAFKEIRYVDGMIADLRNRFTKLSA
jgi:predicted ATPase